MSIIVQELLLIFSIHTGNKKILNKKCLFIFLFQYLFILIVCVNWSLGKLQFLIVKEHAEI